MPKKSSPVSRSHTTKTGRSKPAKPPSKPPTRRAHISPHRKRTTSSASRSAARAKEADLLRQEREWWAPIKNLPDPFIGSGRFSDLVLVVSVGVAGWWLFCALMH